MKLMFRQHKDDPEIVEILTVKDRVTKDARTHPYIVWGVVHIDMIADDPMHVLAEHGDVNVIVTVNEKHPVG